MPNASHTRQAAALRMSDEGASYPEIAEALGFTTWHGAVAAASAARRRRDGRTIRRTARTINLNAVRRMVYGFGVEIECKGLTQAQCADALVAAGINAVAVGYTHEVMAAWKATSDASLHGVACEVVSPILRGEDGIAEMQRVMAALRAAGAHVDAQCGMHVHVGMEALTGHEIASLIDLYAARQTAVNTVLPGDRRRSQWARTLGTAFRQNVTGQFRRTGTVAVGYHGDRYRTVNVCAFPRYGTLEFRQHGGTLNGEKAAAWVRMLWAMATAAASGNAEAVRGGANFLDDLAAAGGLDADSVNYLRRRQAQLAARVAA